MSREDRWGLFGSLFLFAVAYYDQQWRVFWAVAGIIIFLWTLYTVLFVGDSKS